MDEAEPFMGYGGPMHGGPMRTYGRMYGSLDFNDVSINLVIQKILNNSILQIEKICDCNPLTKL